MKEEGFEVITIGTKADVKYPSKNGQPIKSDVCVADVTAEVTKRHILLYTRSKV